MEQWLGLVIVVTKWPCCKTCMPVIQWTFENTLIIIFTNHVSQGIDSRPLCCLIFTMSEMQDEPAKLRGISETNSLGRWERCRGHWYLQKGKPGIRCLHKIIKQAHFLAILMKFIVTSWISYSVSCLSPVFYSVHANNLMKQGNAIKPDKDNMD